MYIRNSCLIISGDFTIFARYSIWEIELLSDLVIQAVRVVAGWPT